jgi:hypothetical protein
MKLQRWIDIYHELSMNEDLTINVKQMKHQLYFRTHPIYVSAVLAFFSEEKEVKYKTKKSLMNEDKVIDAINILKSCASKNIAELFLWGNEKEKAIELLTKRFKSIRIIGHKLSYEIELSRFEQEYIESLVDLEIAGIYLGHHQISVFNGKTYSKRIWNGQMIAISKMIESIPLIRAEEIMIGHFLANFSTKKRNELMPFLNSPFMKSIANVQLDLMEKPGQYHWYHQRAYPIKELILNYNIHHYAEMNYRDACNLFMKG